MHVSQLLNTQLALAESIGTALAVYHGSNCVGLNRPELPHWCESQEQRNTIVVGWATAIEEARRAKGGFPDSDDWFFVSGCKYSLLRIADELALALLGLVEDDRGDLTAEDVRVWLAEAVPNSIEKLDSAAAENHKLWIGLRP